MEIINGTYTGKSEEEVLKDLAFRFAKKLYEHGRKAEDAEVLKKAWLMTIKNMTEESEYFHEYLKLAFKVDISTENIKKYMKKLSEKPPQPLKKKKDSGRKHQLRRRK